MMTIYEDFESLENVEKSSYVLIYSEWKFWSEWYVR